MCGSGDVHGVAVEEAMALQLQLQQLLELLLQAVEMQSTEQPVVGGLLPSDHPRLEL